MCRHTGTIVIADVIQKPEAASRCKGPDRRLDCGQPRPPPGEPDRIAERDDRELSRNLDGPAPERCQDAFADVYRA